jgi:hypothetical protein
MVTPVHPWNQYLGRMLAMQALRTVFRDRSVGGCEGGQEPAFDKSCGSLQDLVFA